MILIECDLLRPIPALLAISTHRSSNRNRKQAGGLSGANEQIKVGAVHVGSAENRPENTRSQQTVPADKVPQFVAVRCKGFRRFHGAVLCSPLFHGTFWHGSAAPSRSEGCVKLGWAFNHVARLTPLLPF